MGSIRGRFEENDYFELATALHFDPKITNKEKTFYTTQGQLIGNVSNKSIEGIVTSLPEL